MVVDVTQVLGWAGSGKTKRLTDGICKALPALGNDPHAIGVSSFSRASNQASVERAAKAFGCTEKYLREDGYFKTMHAIAYQGIEAKHGSLITGKKDDVEWLSESLGCELHTSFDPTTGEAIYKAFDQNSIADTALNLWTLSRASMKPIHEVAAKAIQVGGQGIQVDQIVSIVRQYETSKRVDGRQDFTDLVSSFAGINHDPVDGSYHVEPEGYVPAIQLWVFDEFQDTSPLLMEVCRRLVSAPTVRKVVLAGDPGQTIHQWNGADPNCFLGYEYTRREFMHKTWRCPSQVVEVGTRALGHIKNSEFKYDREIEAAHDNGVVRRCSSMDYLSMCKPGEDWLVLARTRWHAQRIFDHFKKLQVPVTSTGTTEGVVSKKQIGLKALLDMERGRPVTGSQFANAIALLPSKDSNSDVVVQRGFKNKWKDQNHIESWEVVFSKELQEAGIAERGAGYILSGTWPKLVNGGTAWREVVDRHGIDHTKAPTIKVGTVHSAKGLEAEKVFVLTTTSERIEKSAGRDIDRANEEARISYVAATRAKQELVICNELGPFSMRGLK